MPRRLPSRSIRVGSTNPPKLLAVRRAFRRAFGGTRRFSVRGVEVDSGVSMQPWGNETLAGARNRARAAIGDAAYGVGIEAGLFRMPATAGSDAVFDVQYCVVLDRKGTMTWGHGPGFSYPRPVIGHVRRGGTVGSAARVLYRRRGIGRREGMIGHLTRGAEDRAALTEQAVLMALVPRIRPALYARGGRRRVTRRSGSR